MTITTYSGLPVSINGHEYARDRAPYDDPIRLQLWRRRWSCGCGQTGDWQLRTDDETHSDWVRHAEQALLRAQPRRRHRRVFGVPRSADQRTSVPPPVTTAGEAHE